MKRRRDRISVAIGGAALLTAVLVVGSVFRWTQATVAVLVAGALVFQVSSRRKLDRWSPIVVLPLLAAAFCALQLIPLPHGVIAALNGTGSALRDDGAALASTDPWSCISMDPPGTLRALAFFVTLAGVAVLSLRIASSERGRYVLMGGVAIACGLAAAVTGVHVIVNADSLYGLYTPVQATPPVLGPLLNPNHLGCLMAFGSATAVGLVFYEKQTAQWRALWVVISVGCAVIALASQSRGAAISLALGIAVTSGILIGRGLGEASRSRGRTFRQLPIAFVMAVGLGLAVFASAGDVADQLDRTTTAEVDHPTSKFAAWKSSVSLVGETPWVGVGRGAVESTLTRVFDASSFATFSHLENEYVSAIVEWGIPAAFVLALVLAWAIITALRRWRDGALAAGALGALAGVMFQSSVDFGIQLLGIAVPVTIVAATVVVVPLRETSKFRWLRVLRWSLVLGLLAAAYVVMLPAARTLQEDHDLLDASETPDQGVLLEVIQRHPLDYFAFGRSAEQMADKNDPRTVPFLNHALILHPSHPGLHRLAARLLAAADRKPQAAVEYGLALSGTIHPHLLLTEIVAVLPDAGDAANAIPVDYFAPQEILLSLEELKREDVSEHWLVRLLDAPTRDLKMTDELYDMAMLREDYDVAFHTATVRMHDARTNTSRLMLAKVEFARHDYDAVRRELADVANWRGRIDEQGDAWLLVCDTYSARSEWEDALQCIHQVDGSGLMAARRDDISKRLQEISDHRHAEVRLQNVQELERSMNLPVDTYIPVLHDEPSGSASTSPIINPLLTPRGGPPHAPEHSAAPGHQ